MMKGGRILAPCALALSLILSLVVSVPAPAYAQESNPDLQLLAAKLEFIRLFEAKLPDLPFHDGAYEELVSEITARRERARAEGDGELDRRLLALSQDAFFSRAQSRARRGDAAGAVELYLLITGGTRDGGALAFPDERRTDPHFLSSARALAEIAEQTGDERLGAGDKQAALAAYEDAIAAYGAAEDEAATLGVQGKRIDLLGEQGITAFNQDRFEDAFRYLKDLADKNPPGFEQSEAYRYYRRLMDETTVLTFTEIPVPPQVKGKALGTLTVRLEATSGGRSLPAGPFFTSKRWLNGNYTAVLSDGRQELMRLPLTLPSSEPVAVPRLFPEGMVFVPADSSRDVPRPFFIDQREVSVAQYRDIMQDGSFRSDSGTLPAYGITYERARVYAEKAGKKLPTEAQWKWAVFGATGNPFPWGSDGSNLQRYCNINTRRVSNVGSFPAGRSQPFGLDDAAGNVWEWLRDPANPGAAGGWAIGGGCNGRFLIAPRAMRPTGWNEDPNYLLHPQPDWIVYKDVLTGSRQAMYDRYKIENKPEDLNEVGIRCVIEL